MSDAKSEFADRTIFDDIAAERARAHAKHGDTSCEAFGCLDPARLPILVEEVGEVAQALNDMRHDVMFDEDALAHLRTELVQVAAVAVAWIAACDREAM